MHPRFVLTPELRSLAKSQAGVLSRRQALSAGLSRESVSRLVRTGEWARLWPGIYDLSLETTWLGRAWAGVIMGGARAVLGGRSAAHLEGLLNEPAVITVWVGRGWKPVSREGYRFVSSDRIGIGSPPRTMPADTVLDLAADLTADELLTMVSDAVAHGRMNLHSLERALSSRPRVVSTAKLLREVVSEFESGKHSPLELRFARDVESAHGLPVGRRQVRLGMGRSDILYDPYSLIVELDGRVGHSGAGVSRDMTRDNQHLLQGFATLRFGWNQLVGAPCQTARILASALRERGWAGRPTRCPQCPPEW